MSERLGRVPIASTATVALRQSCALMLRTHVRKHFLSQAAHCGAMGNLRGHLSCGFFVLLTDFSFFLFFFTLLTHGTFPPPHPFANPLKPQLRPGPRAALCSLIDRRPHRWLATRSATTSREKKTQHRGTSLHVHSHS